MLTDNYKTFGAPIYNHERMGMENVDPPLGVQGLMIYAATWK